MSEPAWVGAGRGDEVGTATIATDGTFTITAHGLDEGTPVEVDALSGGAISVLRTDTTYFAINIAADTFQLVSARGDQLITFGSTGGADVFTRVPHMLAIQLRRLDSGLLFNDTDDGFGAREGVHPSCDPAVSVAGTTWTVHDIVGTVFPRETATSGPYRFAHPEQSGGFNPADGAQDRIDALYLQIQDNDEDNNGFRRARVIYAAGDPAADPDPPDQETEAPGSLELGTFDVLAGGAGISVRSLSLFTVAAGGVLPITDSSQRPTSGLYDGMVLFNQATGVLEVRFDGAWHTVPLVQIPTVTNEVTSDTNVGGSETTVVSAPSITGDGVSRVKVTIKWYGVHNDGDPAQSFLQLRIKRGSTTLDQVVHAVYSTAAHLGGSLSVTDTPPSGAQTYSFAANPLTANANHVVDAGSGALVSIRVEQVFD